VRRIINGSSSAEIAVLEESIPRVLGNKSFADKFSAEMKQHHRYLGVLFHYSDHFPRSLRALSLAVNIIVMLFVQSLTYDLTNPDDGSCARYRSKESCLARRSPFGTGGPLCDWSAAAETCSFIEPSDDFTIVLFVAIFSAIVSSPIAILQNLIIRNYLAAPTAAAEEEDLAVQASTERLSARSLTQGPSATYTSKISEPILLLLIEEMKSFRATLDGLQRKEFDRK
jgi:hypothetical protein